MKITAESKISFRGAIEATVIHKDGSKTDYPKQTNTWTYNVVRDFFGETPQWNIIVSLTSIMHTGTTGFKIGTGSTPITKNSNSLTSLIAQNPVSVSHSGPVLVNISGTQYYETSSTYTYNYGDINATISEVGCYGTSGLHCGLVLDNAIEVTNDDQLRITYYKYINAPEMQNGALTHASIGFCPHTKTDFFSFMPEKTQNIMIKSQNTNVKTKVIAMQCERNGGNIPFIMFGGNQNLLYFNSSDVADVVTNGLGCTVISTDIGSDTNDKTRTYQTHEVTYRVTPSAGTITIGSLGSHGFTYVYHGDNFSSVYTRFTPPFVKTDSEKLEITIEQKICFDLG